jgi:hypothetical protein
VQVELVPYVYAKTIPDQDGWVLMSSSSAGDTKKPCNVTQLPVVPAPDTEKEIQIACHGDVTQKRAWCGVKQRYECRLQPAIASHISSHNKLHIERAKELLGLRDRAGHAIIQRELHGSIQALNQLHDNPLY